MGMSSRVACLPANRFIGGVEVQKELAEIAHRNVNDNNLAVRIAILSLIASVDSAEACRQLLAAGESLRAAITRAAGQPPA